MVSVAITTICDMVDHARLRLDDIGPIATVPATNLELIQQAAEVADESELLWTTPELTHFANEAIREVAIRTQCIRDSSRNVAGVTSYAITAGTNSCVLDNRILGIKRAWWDDKVLTPDSEQFLDEQTADFNRSVYWGVYANPVPNWRTEDIETPTRYVVERTSRRVQTVGVPTVDGILSFDVIRLPLAIIESGEPEIPQQFLADCLDWMCHLAYLKNDADTYDPKRSATFAELFEYKVGPRPTDQRLQMEYRQGGRRRSRLYWY